MGLLFESELNEHTAAATRDLFARVLDAEHEWLTSEQRENPRKYLIDTWHEAAEAVMRPIQRRDEIETELREMQEKALGLSF